MQGKIQLAMRSGCALWLIVKCCPGAHCQTPLNGLHSRKQSVAVTKGLVGTGPVMIDLQQISEVVSKNRASPKSHSGRSECPQSRRCGITSVGARTKKQHRRTFFSCPNFPRLENMTCLVCQNINGVALRGMLIGMTNCVYLHASFIWYLHRKLLHDAVCYSQTVNPSGYIACLPALLYTWGHTYACACTHTHTAASSIRQQSCRLSSGVSMCSVTTTPGVSLITEGSKGHELHSSGGSLQPPEKQLLL